MSLAYYRGFQEFAATPFLTNADDLARRMTGVACLGVMALARGPLLHPTDPKAG